MLFTSYTNIVGSSLFGSAVIVYEIDVEITISAKNRSKSESRFLHNQKCDFCQSKDDFRLGDPAQPDVAVGKKEDHLTKDHHHHHHNRFTSLFPGPPG